MSYDLAIDLFMNGSFFQGMTEVYNTPTNNGASWIYAMIVITIMIVIYIQTNNSVMPAMFGIIITAFLSWIFPPALIPLLYTIVPISIGLVIMHFLIRAKS